MSDLSIPYAFVSGTTANASEVNANFDAIKATVNTTGVPKLQAGAADLAAMSTNLQSQLGLVGAADAEPRRGKSIIAAAETRAVASYATLATPDSVTVTLPSEGLIRVYYTAQAKISAGSGSARMFIDGNALECPTDGGISPSKSLANISGSFYTTLYTHGAGLTCDVVATVDSPTPSTTGSTLGTGLPASAIPPTGSATGTTIFAAAGSHTITIQYFASGGTMTVRNRKLWVEAIGF